MAVLLVEPPPKTISCDFLTQATYYAKHGLRVFPVVPWDSKLEPLGKRPAIRSWQYQATTNLATIEKWAKKFPNHNVGICTTGYLVIDVDSIEGTKDIQKLENENTPLPPTMKTQSSNPHKYHLIYKSPPELDVHQDRNEFGRDIDIKGWHNMVVAGGSIHKSGIRYQELLGPEHITDAPDWVVKRCKTTLVANRQVKKEIEWNDKTRYDPTTLVEYYISRYPLTPNSRHVQQSKIITSCLCKDVEHKIILEVGKLWLEHFQDEYNLDVDSAYEEFVRSFNYCSENYIPYQPDPNKIILSDPVLKICKDLSNNSSDLILLEVLFREYTLCNNYNKKTSTLKSAFKCAWGQENNLTLTNKQLAEGYKFKTGKGISVHSIMKFKRRFISTKNDEKEWVASEEELFVRTKIGSPGRPSIYEPTETLLKLLEDYNVEFMGYSSDSEEDEHQHPEEEMVSESREDRGSSLQGEVLHKPPENRIDCVQEEVHGLCIRDEGQPISSGSCDKSSGGGILSGRQESPPTTDKNQGGLRHDYVGGFETRNLGGNGRSECLSDEEEAELQDLIALLSIGI